MDDGDAGPVPSFTEGGDMNNEDDDIAADDLDGDNDDESSPCC